MVAQIFPPDDTGGATIHDEVGPLVDKGNVVERCLGKEGGEGEQCNQCQTEQ